MFSILLAGEFSTEFIKIMSPTLLILMVLISIAISVLILIQEGNTNEITGLNSSTSDTFYGKNKSKSKESTLKKWTVGLAIALLIVSTLFFIFKI